MVSSTQACLISVRKVNYHLTQTFYPSQPDRTPGLVATRFVTLVVLLFVLISLGNSFVAAANMQYQVTATAVRVRSGLRNVEVPLAEVVDVTLVEKPTGGLRVFGTGLPGLKTGRWRFTETGDINLYATQLDALVVVDAGDDRWGLSPSDPQGFMQAIANRTPGTFQPPGSLPRVLLGLAVPVLLVVVAAGAVLYTMGAVGRFGKALRYELGPEGLTIRTGLRPVRIGYREIGQVETASPKGFPLRLAGASVGGLLWGRFRWPEAGPKLRLYATRMKPLVLLRLKDGRTFGITPAQSEQFVAAVEQRLG